MAEPVYQQRWVPLSAREDPARAKDFLALHEGVPEWLKDPLRGWIRQTCADPTVFGPAMMSELEAAMQLELRFEVSPLLSELPPERYLDVVDYVLGHPSLTNLDSRLLDNLEDMLLKGGSVWRATDRGLERRVDETLQSVADSVFITNGRPADYLRSAWHKAWGRNPDASGAHQEAVNATEAAYAHIVSPMNDRATLGTIIRDIRAKPPKFRVRLQATTGEEDVGRVAAMMELLLKSQRRHGTDDRSGETIEEARDAVALATTLVHLAQQGGFTASGR